MSEKQEHKKRFQMRMRYVAEYDKWLSREPSMWRVIAWHRWKAEKPIMEDMTDV